MSHGTFRTATGLMFNKRVVVRAPAGRAMPAAALFFAGSLVAGASSATAASYVDMSRLLGTRAAAVAAVRDRDDCATLADIMAELKQRTGFTWEELGALFSVSRKTVHNWVNGAPIKDLHRDRVQQLFERVRALASLRPFEVRAALLGADGQGSDVRHRAEPPILFADQTPSAARINVRKGGMKIARRNGAAG